MEANREESEKCLQLSKAAHERGDKEAALKLALKSMRLYDNTESRHWLDTLQDNNNNNKEEDSSSKINSSNTLYTKEQETEVSEFLNVNKNDYYAVLSVKKNADSDELKRAYKKMALKFHPDKNQAPGADEAFKVVGTAFACLSEPEKRRRYDMMGVSPNTSSSQFGHHFTSFNNPNDISMDDLFRQFFSAFSEESIFQPNIFQTGGPQSTFFYQQFGFSPNNFNVRRRKHNVNEEEQEVRRRERRREYAENEAMIVRFIQLLPLLFIIVLSFLSSLLFPQE